MAIFVSYFFMTLLLLGLEWMLRLGRRGRMMLGSLVLLWAMVNLMPSVRDPGHHSIERTVSDFLGLVVPLILWQFASWWIRAEMERRKAVGLSFPSVATNDELTDIPDVSPVDLPGAVRKQKEFDVTRLLGDEQAVDPKERERASEGVPSALANAKVDGDGLFKSDIEDDDDPVVITYGRPIIRDMVLIAVGAPGSGKTSTLESTSDEAVGIKIEETLDDLEYARDMIQQILDSGRKPLILRLCVDDPAKLVDRVVKRAEKIGRVDNVDQMAKAYANVPKVIAALQSEFIGRIKIHVADNSGPPGEMRFIEDSSRIWSPLEDALATRAGLAQVDATNRMFRENPNYEVKH